MSTLTERWPQAFAKAQGILAVKDEGLAVHVLTAPTVSLDALAEARRLLHKQLRIEAVSADRFSEMLAVVYDEGSSVATPNLAVDKITDAADAPTVARVNQLFLQALAARASDIHLEPTDSGAQLRHRIDGVLYPAGQFPLLEAQAVVARLKVMASLDLAERRLPQDGRMRLNLEERAVDVRVATLPSLEGERVVLRLLDTSQAALQLSALGMAPALLSQVEQLLGLANGLVLVTGPTGSGKTTTLYAMIAALARVSHNIMTVEDPIEYRLSGISQSAVQPAIGFDFARALRAMLRQDPDVIMIGEIRDQETAEIAVQASLTGHLVFATLHTNDAVSAVSRLRDMGLAPYLLSASLRAVMAQRLIRLTCTHCGGKGCAYCQGSGYHGRRAVYEALVVGQSERDAIHQGEVPRLTSAPLIAAAKQLADRGETTMAEVNSLAYLS